MVQGHVLEHLNKSYQSQQEALQPRAGLVLLGSKLGKSAE